jgi:hypothetical protein
MWARLGWESRFGADRETGEMFEADELIGSVEPPAGRGGSRDRDRPTPSDQRFDERLSNGLRSSGA